MKLYMNEEFLKLDNKSYVVSNETGKLEIVNMKESTSIDNLENVLKLENYIEKLYDELKECNKNVVKFTENIKERSSMYKMFCILPIVLAGILSSMFIVNTLKDALIIYIIMFLFTCVAELPMIAYDIITNGTIKSNKKNLNRNLENKKQLLGEIKTNQKELNDLKNNINYSLVKQNKESDYSYKFQPRIVDNYDNIKKESKIKTLKND